MITSGDPPDGTVNESYFFQITAAGGQGPLSLWAIPTETIPGLEYTEDGVLVGIPTSAATGTWEIQVSVYDNCVPEPQTLNETYTITIGE